MTRRVVYLCGLLLTVACTAMTIASIVMPRWITFDSSDENRTSIGLHRRYTSGRYQSFPRDTDCAKDASFCNMWRSVGFFISFDVAVELCTLVAFIVIIAGGVQRRAAGWTVVSGLLSFSAFVQMGGMAIVSYVFNHGDRFANGWYLDISWALCTTSWILLALTSIGVTASALYLAPEDDYELIPDDQIEVIQDDQLYSRIGAWNDGYRRSEGYQQSAPSIRSYQREPSIRSYQQDERE